MLCYPETKLSDSLVSVKLNLSSALKQSFHELLIHSLSSALPDTNSISRPTSSVVVSFTLLRPDCNLEKL